MENKNSYTYLDSKQVEHTISFNEGDFTLVQEDKKLYDQKMQTKPTTFLKDALRRFAKNKSSVVGGIILGVIILLAIVLPMVLPADISSSHAAEYKLAPKLFEAGTGWWDGCESHTHVAIDTDWEEYDRSGTITGYPADYDQFAVVGGLDGITYEDVTYINAVNKYAHNGYVRVNLAKGNVDDAIMHCWDGHSFNVTSNNVYSVSIKTIDPSANSDWNFGKVAQSYSVYFNWADATNNETVYKYPLGENVAIGDTKSFSFGFDELSTLDADVGSMNPNTQHPYVSIEIKSDETDTNNLLIEEFIITSTKEYEKEELENMSIYDANTTLLIKPKKDDGTYNKYYWSTLNGNQNLYHAKLVYGSFRFDTYDHVFGDRYTTEKVTIDLLKQWASDGWIEGDFSIIDGIEKVPASQRQGKVNDFIATLKHTELGKSKCPLKIDEEHPVDGKCVSAGGIVAVEIHGTVTRWKLMYPYLDSCPKYLFGTDSNGKDLVKLTFSGLRTSLLLGLIVAVITFAFGLVWGAIAGYFGGWVDILMERFTDILGGVPWIVLMTLAIIKFGSSFGVFVMALCMTGWIGTASLTRTQFYRYKNREYILASRTLGASDFRLIFRHILPNAVGTIVTSSVFMITSVIYSEATIAYLNLGLKGLDSFGIILANNQADIMTYPHLILFPSIIMLLMMISFNLFGNGLRDAFNPSLKGED